MLIRKQPVQDKEPKNFKEIFNSYYPAVCRQAAYLLGTTEAVDDIAQETFLRLYYSPPAEFTSIKGWLFRVTANLCYNYLKSEKSRKTREENTFYDKNVIPLEDMVMRDEVTKVTRKVLLQMNARDRMALLLKFSGYSYEEIAQIIEVEKSSVGTVLSRSIQKFKNLYIQAEGGDPYVL